jgi:hypothetical protein
MFCYLKFCPVAYGSLENTMELFLVVTISFVLMTMFGSMISFSNLGGLGIKD